MRIIMCGLMLVTGFATMAEGQTKTTALTLDALGLAVDAPEGSRVRKLGRGFMVQGSGVVFMVEVASSTRPTSPDKAKADAVDEYGAKAVHVETLADGWALLFENSGSAGANFFVEMRRDIGGKSYWCEATVSSLEQRTAAAVACKSLRPVPGGVNNAPGS